MPSANIGISGAFWFLSVDAICPGCGHCDTGPSVGYPCHNCELRGREAPLMRVRTKADVRND